MEAYNKVIESKSVDADYVLSNHALWLYIKTTKKIEELNSFYNRIQIKLP
jgi:hypothetical protein